MDLEIIEPLVPGDNLVPSKRSLVYPMEIALIRPDQQELMDYPSPPPANGGRQRRRRRRRRGSPDAPSQDETGHGAAVRAPVHAQLGQVRQSCSRSRPDAGIDCDRAAQAGDSPDAVPAPSMEKDE